MAFCNPAPQEREKGFLFQPHMAWHPGFKDRNRNERKRAVEVVRQTICNRFKQIAKFILKRVFFA